MALPQAEPLSFYRVTMLVDGRPTIRDVWAPDAEQAQRVVREQPFMLDLEGIVLVMDVKEIPPEW